jgi:tetratricopeptide (TPR) repeat protein
MIASKGFFLSTAIFVTLSVVSLSLVTPAWSQVAGKSASNLDEPTPERWSSRSHMGGLDYYALKQDAKLGVPFAIALQKGRALARNKQYGEACAAFAEAATIKPTDMPYDEWGDASEAMGNRKEAIQIYRLAVYSVGTDQQGLPNRIYPDKSGNTTPENAKMDTSAKQKWVSRFRDDPTLLMRYALLLSRDKQYAEALTVYERGREIAFRGNPLGEQFRLRMTAVTFQRGSFEAAAHTIIGKTITTFRSLQYYAWPDDARIAEYQIALKARPYFAPALLFIGVLYEDHYDQTLRQQSVPTIRQAMYYGSPGIREEGQKQLGNIEIRRSTNAKTYGTPLP